MIETIKAKHFESHWSCGDGCCDNYSALSAFMYKDQVYEFETGTIDGNISMFLEKVIGIVFEEEVEYEDADA